MVIFFPGEMWKTEVELVTRQNSHLSRPDLAHTVLQHLINLYPVGVLWVVVVYDDVTGGDKHTITGYDYYNLFRHYGNNIVVARIVFPRNRDPPSDLGNSFSKAYSPVFDGKHIDAWKTNEATWSNLPNHGVAPWNLFFLRDGIAYGYWAHIDSRIHHTELPSKKGFAFVIGEKY